jgi:5-hydroxyisourate hydrolase
VLDTALGSPACGVGVRLERWEEGDRFRELARGETDADGRVKALLPADTRLEAGVYRLTFQVEQYLASTGRKGFYPYVAVVFEVMDASLHHHVPLLLSPFGYSTYRGS